MSEVTSFDAKIDLATTAANLAVALMGGEKAMAKFIESTEKTFTRLASTPGAIDAPETHAIMGLFLSALKRFPQAEKASEDYGLMIRSAAVATVLILEALSVLDASLAPKSANENVSTREVA
jgi:hypothetical protein